MADILPWIGGAIALAGVFLSIIGSIGVLRFPDVYTRIHAASITDTGGATLVLLGLGLIAGLDPVAIKLALVWIFIMLTTPAAANALANAALSSGHHPRIGAFQLVRTDERRRKPRDGEGA
jgi:multicomponent Na+:H+ antiporter subunit G